MWMDSADIARNLRYDLLKSAEIRRYNGEFLRSVISGLPYSANKSTPTRKKRLSGCARLEMRGFMETSE